MILLLDIGNTNTHIGFADARRVVRRADVPTKCWLDGTAPALLASFTRRRAVKGAALCSVVPQATPKAEDALQRFLGITVLRLTHRSVRGVGIDYPRPATIGTDRLANAVAARHWFGAPAVVVDFGTAVTFDVVNRRGDYVGGVIAPGLSAMTEYLHEKTALLPRIRIREIRQCIGRSTREAMLVGAVHGYRGLIRQLIQELRQTLRTERLPVIATGGYAGLMARGLPEITAVRPNLTLEGLRLTWRQHHST